MKKTGLLITTYNRPEYLKKCLDTLEKCNLKNIMVLFVDDASTEKGTKELINNFGPHYYIANTVNSGVSASLIKGYDFLFSMDCEYVINLDSDAIVSKDFIGTLIDLKEKFPSDIITGFNTLTKNEKGIVRHQVVKQNTDHCIKRSAGGINYLISRDIYEGKVHAALTETRSGGDWDNLLCSRVDRVIASTPSVVDHIGMESSIGVRHNPDTAHDFKKEPVNAIVINQPRGLGDILFSMKAVLEFANGREIIWPVMSGMDSIGKHFPGIKFVDWKELKINYDLNTEYESEYGRVIPLRFSDSICKVPYYDCMKSKYLYFKNDWTLWKDIGLVRDFSVELDLYLDVLGKHGIAEGEPYNLVNTIFRTDQSGGVKINPDNGFKNVYMSEVKGFTLIDWSKIIENAEHIYTVGTSINYLIELLEVKAKSINLYVRRPDEVDFKNYEYILDKTKPYILHM